MSLSTLPGMFMWPTTVITLSKKYWPATDKTVTVTSGLSYPTSIVMDKTGNLYIADGALKEIPAGSTTVKVLTDSNLIGGVGHLAIDKYGDLYITDSERIFLIPATTINFLPIVTNVSFLSAYSPVTATGIAIDASLNIYVASSSGIPSYELSGVYLLTTPLPPGLAFNNNTGVISGAATAISPATNYTVIACGVAASSSATVNLNVLAAPAPAISYSSPQTFYVGGQVGGLTPASSYVAALAYNSAPTVFASGLTANATYMAQDAPGNFYVSNTVSGKIQEVPAGGGTPVTVFYCYQPQACFNSERRW